MQNKRYLIYETHLLVRFTTGSEVATVPELRSKSTTYQLFVLTETECTLDISLSLSMAFAAEAYRVVGQVPRFKSAINKLNSLKFRYHTRRPTVSKRVKQCFEPLKTFFKRSTSR
jgi:hypothetical protein